MIRRIVLYSSLALLIFLILLLAGCSTKKNTLMSRGYHNITAHYNVYFNAYESYKKGMKKVDKNSEENYSLILPIYKTGDPNIGKSLVPEMNKTIEKCSKAIRKHSITEKPRGGKLRMSPKEKAFYEKPEYCKWIDDAYILMGKANYYKQDYFAALETFNYIVRQYNKVEEKYDGLYWIARTYCDMQKFNDTRQFIDQLTGDKYTPKRLDPDILLLTADYHMKLGEYEKVTDLLEKYLRLKPKKQDRIRYTFILAQIYQKLKDNKKASKYYDLVLKMNPPYEMTFNAQINRARLFSAESGDSREIRKQLNKMLKDDKNIEYQDQIYYALANIDFNEGYEEEAIKNYILSTQKSTRNANQKGLSFLAIAEIYFSKPDYVKAQMYFDSTVTFIAKDYPDYEIINARSSTLNELVTNLNIIQREDSLQRVASMSEKERILLIDQIIARVKEAEESKKQEEEKNRFEASTSQMNTNMMMQDKGTGGKWYFYNPAVMGIGRSGFLKKWGNRKLEDNWRRKNKDITADFGSSDSNTSDSSANKKLSNTTREFYLQDLPLNDSLKLVSRGRVEEAYYNLALVYKDKLMAYNDAIQNFEGLVKRFPKGQFELYSYYNLLKVNVILKNEPRTEYYKQLIISDYPNSNYAKVLQNPDFFKELEKIQEQVNFFYTSTYQMYLGKKYDQALKNCQYADSMYSDNPVMPKFALVRAFIYGAQTADTLVFVKELKVVKKKYPKSDEAALAIEMLSVLEKKKEKKPLDLFADKTNEGGLEEEDSAQNKRPKVDYQFNNQSTHYYIIAVNGKKVDVNELIFRLSNFNLDNFSSLTFEIKNLVLDADIQLIQVKSFKNKNQGMNYFESIVSNSTEVFTDINTNDFRHFIITIENFALLFKDKRILDYVDFFEKNYPVNK